MIVPTNPTPVPVVNNSPDPAPIPSSTTGFSLSQFVGSATKEDPVVTKLEYTPVKDEKLDISTTVSEESPANKANLDPSSNPNTPGSAARNENVEKLMRALKDLNEFKVKAQDTIRTLQQRLKESIIQVEKMNKEKQQDRELFEKEKEKLKKEFEKEISKLKSEWEEQKQALEEQVASVSDQLELITLDKELAEEKAEALEMETENLKQQVNILEMSGKKEESKKEVLSEEDKLLRMEELEVIKEENDRLKEALMKLRDLTVNEKHEKERQIKELERDLHQLRLVADKLSAAENNIKDLKQQNEDLKEQVDASTEAQDLAEQLTEKNMNLEEKMKELEHQIEELEALRTVSEELEESQQQVEKQLRSELYAKEIQILDLEGTIQNQKTKQKEYEKVVEQFKNIVQKQEQQLSSLKNEKEYQLAAQEQKTIHLTSMLQDESRLVLRAKETYRHEMGQQLRQLASECSHHEREFFKDYLPLVYSNLAAYRNILEWFLTIFRCRAKSLLMTSWHRKFESDDEVLWKVKEEQLELVLKLLFQLISHFPSVWPGIGSEEYDPTLLLASWSSIETILDFLLTQILNQDEDSTDSDNSSFFELQFTRVFNETISLIVTLKLPSPVAELIRLVIVNHKISVPASVEEKPEKSEDVWTGDNLRLSEFYLCKLFVTEVILNVTTIRKHVITLLDRLDNIPSEKSDWKSTLQEGRQNLQRIIDLSKKITRTLEEYLPPLPPHTSRAEALTKFCDSFQQIFEQCSSLLTLVPAISDKSKTLDLSTTDGINAIDGIFVEKVAAEVQSLGFPTFLQLASGKIFEQCTDISNALVLSGSPFTLTTIERERDASKYIELLPLNKTFPTYQEGAELVKKELTEASAWKQMLGDLQLQVRELKKQLQLKDNALQDSKWKEDGLLKKLTRATKTEEKLNQMIQEQTKQTTEKQQMYQQALDTVQKDKEKLASENKALKEKVLVAEKVTSVKSSEENVLTAEKAVLLSAEVQELQAAVRFLRQENFKLKNEGSNLEFSMKKKEEKVAQNQSIAKGKSELEALTLEFAAKLANAKIIDLKQPNARVTFEKEQEIFKSELKHIKSQLDQVKRQQQLFQEKPKMEKVGKISMSLSSTPSRTVGLYVSPSQLVQIHSTVFSGL